MISLAKLSIRRPKAALAGWVVAAAVLTVIGFGVSKTLSPSITVVKGTESARAQQIANAEFGPTQLIPILLEGPKAQLSKQGPKLVAELMKRPHTRVMSAWDAGSASATMRPNAWPRAGLIVVSVDKSEKQVVETDQPQIEQLVARTIGSPVRSYITGQPSLDRAIKDASINNLRQTELIAAGILFLLLLVGLRAPIAALVVTGVGAFSMLAGFGEVTVLGKIMHLDPLGVALGTMTGLAFGVGFSLMILDRFHREELPRDVHPRTAAAAAIRELETTGKAVLVGGTAVIVALLLVAVIGPTELMVSLGTGMTTCAIFATGGAVVVMPAVLVLMGRRLDWLSFPAPRFLTRAWSGLVNGGNWVTRHAVFTGFAATVLLGAIAVPALALDTGPTDISALPANAKARIAFEEVSRVMGPGFPTPYNMIIVAKGRPITDPNTLTSINRLQTSIAASKTVYSVTGPAAIFSTSEQLKKFGPGLVHSAKISKKSKKDLVQLINGLGLAGSGSAQLQSGLQQAVSGANQLHGGSGQAAAGSSKLHAGLAQARAGSGQLSDGLNLALAGANALKVGAGQALTGSNQLVQALGLTQTPASASISALNSLSSATAAASSNVATAQHSTSSAQSSVNNALSSVQSMPDSPEKSQAIGALNAASGDLNSLNGQLTTAAGNAAAAKSVSGMVSAQAPGLLAAINMLHEGAGALQSGIGQLRDGNAQLANGIGQLAGGGGQLKTGLGQLTDGAGQLEAGLTLLNSGTGQLATGLAPAPAGAGQLVNGLGLMQAGVIKSRGQIPSTKDLETLMKQSPGMFSSGYFVLSAVEGALPADRNAASFTVNLLNGGTSGQVLVVSKYPDSDPRTVALGDQLVRLGQAYAKHNNAQVAVGGPAGSRADMTSVTKDRLPLAIAAIAIALTLILGLALRAVVLPAVSTAFSLLVAGATFGVLQLLYGGSNPPLGGPGWMDPMTIMGIFTVVFGISVVFSTWLLMRAREPYVRGEGSQASVAIGLRETAAAATGAGIVMVAAIVPFVLTDFINVQQFGIGVTVAILLEVLIVRPVLLPAGAAVLGRFGWWPTHGPREPKTEVRGEKRRRPRPHLPHRKPRPAHS